MKYIVGNWKMFPQSIIEAKQVANAVKKIAIKSKRTKTVLCPPFVYAGMLAGKKTSSRFSFGVQNAFYEIEGAYTGEISPNMLRSLGLTHVILGHSERRAMGETNIDIAKKVSQAVRSELMVVLCVGEKIRDEHVGYFREVKDQLSASLEGFPKAKSKQIMIAYEPVWAIGTKALRAASSKDCEEMVIHIRRTLVEIFGKNSGFAIPILYGGSADESNAEGFLREGKADGLLVGRASLDPKRLGAMIAIAEKVK